VESSCEFDNEPWGSVKCWKFSSGFTAQVELSSIGLVKALLEVYMHMRFDIHLF
jgi:hypothetical protein